MQTLNTIAKKNKTVVLDCETNALTGYEKFWVAVSRDVESGEVVVFKNVHEDPEPLRAHLNTVDVLGGHNLVGFDLGVLRHFLGIDWPLDRILDTLVISRLLDYRREGGHSLENLGAALGYKKSLFNDFSQWSEALQTRCIIDTEISLKVYDEQKAYIYSKKWAPIIQMEIFIQGFCQDMSTSGFHFDIDTATELCETLEPVVAQLEEDLRTAFVPWPVFVREINPRATKSGALHSQDFMWMKEEVKDLTGFSPGCPFSLIEFVPFNPRSSKQRVERLNEAGWRPINKTKAHIEAERAKDVDKIRHYRTWGWKVDEDNLATLPESAPPAAHMLSRFLLLSNRLKVLQEWISIYNPQTGRIHGTFTGIGSWTHRMAHSAPNMANVPALVNRHGKPQPYGAEFRSLWTVPQGKILIGCDAEGIQLRLFAHFCNDSKLIEAIINGKKEDKSDIHSLNQSILGPICNTREVAKTYIYALLLGAGKDKQANILSCRPGEALEGLKRILEFYPGWKELKDTRLKDDAKRGYFTGLDGRLVLFPSAHYILAGYLQNGESVVMKRASLFWRQKLRDLGVPFTPVNFVHDEWQVETTPEHAQIVGSTMADSLRHIGEELGLNCPLAGKFVTGMNWKETH
jgi:DNA polymerase-1